MANPKASSASNTKNAQTKGLLSSDATSDDDAIRQAVVVTNDLAHRFYPLTLQRPKCLLPLCGIPLIEYTLEMLSKADIKEVFVVCNGFVEQYKKYIQNSRWNKAHMGMRLRLIVVPQMTSIGDALRDIDDKAVIKGDFVLVAADVVTNVRLADVLTAHKKTRAADRNATITSVLVRTGPTHHAKQRTESAVWLVDAQSKELLFVNPVESELATFEVALPFDVLRAHPNAHVHFDLVDCQIDVCSQEVLSLFTENFDYQDVRKDFVRGVLTSELLSNRFYVHIVDDQYAARVKSPLLYQSISMDVLMRWVFPVVPETNFCSDAHDSVSVRRHNVYVGRDVSIDRTVLLGECVFIGDGCIVGRGAQITRTVLGRNVFVGPNVRISDAFVWSGVRIEDNCVIEHAIVGDSCDVKEGTVVSRGCMLDAECVVGPGVVLPQFTRCTVVDRPLDARLAEMDLSSASMTTATVECDGLHTPNSDQISEKVWQCQEVLGADANCYVWNDQQDADSLAFEYLENSSLSGAERVDATRIGSQYAAQFLAAYEVRLAEHRRAQTAAAAAAYEDDDDDEEEDAATADDAESLGSPSQSRISPVGKEAAASNASAAAALFHRDIVDAVTNAVAASYSIEDTALEINALKFACNTSWKDCRRAIVPALCALIDASNVAQSTNVLFGRWSGLLAKFVHSVDDQVDVLRLLHEALVDSPAAKAFLYVVPLLYQAELLEDRAILAWYDEEQAAMGAYATQIKPFIEWLQASEDESSSEAE